MILLSVHLISLILSIAFNAFNLFYLEDKYFSSVIDNSVVKNKKVAIKLDIVPWDLVGPVL